MAEITKIYGAKPFDEAVQFFQQKVNMPSEKWDELWKGQHAKGFMVAGAMKADLLMDLRGAVSKAITDGESLDAFRKRFDDIVAKRGWVYKGGRNWRTKVIYDTNLRQANNAGRYKQMADPDVIALRPYILYRHGDSRNYRRQHLAWDGLVLRHDDPFWNTHKPQNGWGCKCKIFTLSERDLAKMGKSAPDTSPEINYVDYKNRVTGQIEKIPQGIDPGFDYDPGKAADQSYKILANKFEALPDDIALQWMREYVHGPAFERFVSGAIKGDFPVAVLDETARAAIKAESKVVWFSDDSLAKNKGDLPERSSGHPELSLDEYRLLPDVIGSPDMVVEKQETREVFIKRDGRYYLAALKTTRDKKGLFLVSFRRASLQDVRRERRNGNVIFDRLEE